MLTFHQICQLQEQVSGKDWNSAEGNKQGANLPQWHARISLIQLVRDDV